MAGSRLLPYGTTIFSEMTRLANEHTAINLAQGFPDFDGPPEIIEAATAAMKSGHNQYARSQGHPALVAAIAQDREDIQGLRYDPMTEVAVFSGATEGIASTILGLVEPADEVILIEPYYDSYPVMATLAGAKLVHYTLRAPDFAIDPERLAACFTDRTRLLILNSPHNPSGRVFSDAELQVIADLCIRHGVMVLSDEVYEHLTFDGVKHRSIASLPGMRERTIAISSAGKTFSFTGWKIGWATGPARLITMVQRAHQFVTFATSTPFQIAIAAALELGTPYYDQLRAEYQERRDFLLSAIRDAGFDPIVPQGAYFILAGFDRLARGDDDLAFARRMTIEHGVAVIPPSPFYKQEPEQGRRLIRFAFCKKRQTLELAAERIRGVRP